MRPDFDRFAVLHDLRGVELSERERRELLARIYLHRGYLDSAAEEWIATAGSDPDALITEPDNTEVARIHAGIAARLVAA